MSVYNGTRYVRQAIDSILAQTFGDLEFIIVDDGSTDETADILAGYDDPRIVLLVNDRNIGLTRSLNRGISVSSGEFLARQDADDWSLPQRLERQVAYMEANPAIGLVGTGSRWIDGQDGFVRDCQAETDPVKIQQTLLHAIPFLHGTFFFRRSCLPDIDGGYNDAVPVAQDCDLLLRLSERWDLANLGDVLYVYRQHGDAITAHRSDEQRTFLRQAQQAAIDRRLAYGLARLGLSRRPAPRWVREANRRWLAQRYVWWSAGARVHGRPLAVQFLVIALLLNPTTPEIWRYVGGIVKRKVGCGDG